MRPAILIFLLTILTCQGEEFPPVQDFGPTNTHGAALQRSMRLMVASTPQKRLTVKVLFYRQSITARYWTVELANELKKSFPSANLIFINLAISGFTAEVLSKTAEADVTGFYPDLIIFHDYGSTEAYEKIIATARLRTTADILIQTDHPLLEPDLAEPTRADQLTNPSGDAWRNYVFLPEIASKYGAELADVRTYWKNYLLANGYAPRDLLSDAVHPNPLGEFVMRSLVRSHLRVDRTLPEEAWGDAVKDVALDTEGGSNSTITIPFTGNCVDLVIRSNGVAPVEIRIDGRRPSEFPELYAFTRPSLYPKTVWPSILQVQSRAPLTNEMWIARILPAVTNGSPHVRFAVSGSKTGDDGEWVSTHVFVSNSGRVVIQPADWLMLFWTSWYYPSTQPLPVGHEIRWESRFYGRDEILPQIDDPSLETTVTIAQGLAQGSHTLTLSGETAAIEAVRIYNPLARTQPARTPEIRIESVRLSGGHLTVRASGHGRYIVETSEAADGAWNPVSAPQSERTFVTRAPGQRGFWRLRKID